MDFDQDYEENKIDVPLLILGIVLTIGGLILIVIGMYGLLNGVIL